MQTQQKAYQLTLVQALHIAASYANKIGASLDPVALDYYSAKYILMPAAQQLGYSSYVTLNPDSTYVVPSIQYYCPFHTYLVNSMNELNRHGFQVTMNASQMNVYVSSIAARAHGDCQAPWGSIDMKDIGYVARRFDCRPGKSLWDPIADFNGDDWINMKDVALPSRNFQVSY
jgi:hypothetical protein